MMSQEFEALKKIAAHGINSPGEPNADDMRRIARTSLAAREPQPDVLQEENDLLREKLRVANEQCDSISEQLAKENAKWRRLRLILKEHEINV